MRSFLHISPRDPGHTGPPPEDDPRISSTTLRSQGILSLAFGFALGVSSVILYLLSMINPIKELCLPAISFLTVGLCFAIGFVGGTLLAAIYNLLVVRRLNIFGLESRRD